MSNEPDIFNKSVTNANSQSQSIAGVHWYSGDISLLNTSLSEGHRGWNVETILGVDNTDSKNTAFINAKIAKEHGLINIIRIDYKQSLPVPQPPAPPAPKPSDSELYDDWVNKFTAVLRDFCGIANIFIVGNEPTIESNVSAKDYAAAFNYLYARKKNMLSGTEMLAAGPAAFSPDFLGWLENMANQLQHVDGFAIHAYGDPSIAGCEDPRQACHRNNWSFDGGFQTFREQIDRISKKWGATKPIYITEFNTDVNGLNSFPDPIENYPSGWINKAFEAVRNYNSTLSTNQPMVRALCWFVDRTDADKNNTSWKKFALSNVDANATRLKNARSDMATELKNTANLVVNLFANDAFEKQWVRPDQLVAIDPNRAKRSWIWGPQPQTIGIWEEYADSPCGKRMVQYFDKARMEINNPATTQPSNPSQPLVTNGLLVVEMIEQALHIGDTARKVVPNAANNSVAGDAGGGAPTYAALQKLAFPVTKILSPKKEGQIVKDIIKADGNLETNPDQKKKLEDKIRDDIKYKVTIAEYLTYPYNDNGTQHEVGYNIPNVFIDFFNKKGETFDFASGSYQDGQIFERNVTVGLPLMEPYWAYIKVAGKDQWVLIQAFQRRVLTYTPENAADWRVEMGNVGQHYYEWRYNRPLIFFNVANFVSQSIPTSMSPGQQQSVSVIVQNIGTSAWSGSGSNPYSLVSLDSQIQGTWGGFNPVKVSDVVTQGSTATFNFNVTAPSKPGRYNFQCLMTQQGGGKWLGKYSTPNVVVNVGTAPNDGVNATGFISQSVPTSMKAGQHYNVSVSVKNTGTTTWTSGGKNPYRLGSQNPQDNLIWLGGTSGRVELLSPVAPGSQVTFNFTVSAPLTPGTYNFQWRMVHEGVEWFGEFTPNIVVNVATASPEQPSIHGPTFVYPSDGQTLDYAGAYLFKVNPVDGATGYLWGFFQDGNLVWENNRDEHTLSGTEYGIQPGTTAHSRFHLGVGQVWVRALVNSQWTEATKITIYWH